MTDYKATPEQWAQCEEWVNSPVVGAVDACLLELRARVKALEHEMAMENYRKQSAAISKPTPNLSEIRSSLVDRVALAIDSAPIGTNNSDEARAAIREVAAWLAENAGGTRAAWLLEREAER